MKLILSVVLVALAAALAGCGSDELEQGRAGDRVSLEQEAAIRAKARAYKRLDLKPLSDERLARLGLER